MDRSRSRRSTVLATSALAVLAFIPLARGEWPWAKEFNFYESNMASTSQEGRFELLDRAAFAALMIGEIEKARAYAEESLRLAPSYPDSWNYAYSMYHSHIVLGHLALLRGDVDGAEDELRAAAQAPGSETLTKFGPNMSLAKALLEKGRQTSVLAYFEACRRLWSGDVGHLDAWRAAVERGEIPDFKGHLR